MVRQERQPGRDVADVAALVRARWVAEYRHWFARFKRRKCNYGLRRMPRWDGGTDHSGRRFDAIWPRIAAYCAERGLVPGRLIHSYFLAQTPLSLPAPNQLLSARALALYRDAPGESDLRLRIEYEHQREVLQTEIFRHRHVRGLSDNEAVRAAIHDAERGFTPLFRYCVAWKGNDAEAARPYAGAALAQYVFEREAYDRAWGDMIPERLKRRAARFLARLQVRG